MVGGVGEAFAAPQSSVSKNRWGERLLLFLNGRRRKIGGEGGRVVSPRHGDRQGGDGEEGIYPGGP